MSEVVRCRKRSRRLGVTVVQGGRPPAALDARHFEVDPAGTPRSHGGSRLTGEENGCGEKLLLEAPIVDPWVTMRSSILSAVASVLAGMELMVHLGMRAHLGRSQWVPSQCCCARAERCARVPGSRVVEWRARARVHAVSASDLGRTLANDRGST